MCAASRRRPRPGRPPRACSPPRPFRMTHLYHKSSCKPGQAGDDEIWPPRRARGRCRAGPGAAASPPPRRGTTSPAAAGRRRPAPRHGHAAVAPAPAGPGAAVPAPAGPGAAASPLPRRGTASPGVAGPGSPPGRARGRRVAAASAWHPLPRRRAASSPPPPPPFPRPPLRPRSPLRRPAAPRPATGPPGFPTHPPCACGVQSSFVFDRELVHWHSAMRTCVAQILSVSHGSQERETQDPHLLSLADNKSMLQPGTPSFFGLSPPSARRRWAIA